MENVQLAFDILRRRWPVVLVTLLAGLVAVFFLLRIVPRTYEAASRVLIVNESDGRDPSVSSIDLPSVATSTAVLGGVIDQLRLPISLIDLKKGVKARVTARSSIMEISYRDSSRDRAVSVPNAIADQLSRYYDAIATNRADENVRKLDAAMVNARKRLRALNSQLEARAAQEPFLQSDKALETVTGRLDDLESQRQLAAAALASDGATAQAVAGNAGNISKLARREMLQSNEVYRGLVAGAARDAAQLEFDRAAYTDRYPGLQGLAAKVAAEQAAIHREEQRILSSPDAVSPSQAASDAEEHKAAALVAGDQARVAGLDDLIATERERLQQLPQSSFSSALLKTQRDAAQADFLALSARRTAAVANRAEALSLGSVVVVDRAVRADAAVVGLGRTVLALTTAFLVLALAFGSAFLVEMLDPRLRRAAQIENLYGSQIITVLSNEGQE